MTHHARSKLIVAALVASSAVTHASAEPWPSNEWVGRCFQNQTETGACDLNDPGAKFMIESLNEASKTLERLGFRAPHMDLPYTAFLWSDGVCYEVASAGTDVRQECVPGYYARNAKLLSLAYDNYFAMASTVEFGNRGGEGIATTGFTDSGIHELFHSVQAAYPDFYTPLLPESDWVIEGMATAVAAALDGVIAPSGQALPFLDSPLHRPTSMKIVDPNVDRKQWATAHPDYVNYPFWLFVSKEYGGRLPDGVAVLHDIMLELGKYSATDQSTGDAWADFGLRKVARNGMFDVYPAYIAEVGNDRRFYKNLGNADHKTLLTGKNVFGEATLRISGEVESLSSWAYSLFALGLPDSALEVTLLEPHDGLHLIVDDQLADTAERSGSGYANLYFADKIGRDEDAPFGQKFLIRVANAGRDPSDFRKRMFTLEATIHNEYALLMDALDKQEDKKQENEPLDLSGIDAPVEYEYDGREAWLAPASTEYTIREGIASPCHLHLFFFNRRQQDRVTVQLVNSGPISIGEYPLMNMKGAGKMEAEKFPGQFLSAFELGERNPMMDGYAQGYETQDGVISIDHLSPRWIRGHIRMAGARKNVRYFGHKLTGPQNFDLLINFSLPIGDLPAQEKYIPASDCIDAG